MKTAVETAGNIYNIHTWYPWYQHAWILQDCFIFTFENKNKLLIF